MARALPPRRRLLHKRPHRSHKINLLRLSPITLPCKRPPSSLSNINLTTSLQKQDNIRKSYWHNHDAALSGIQITDEDTHVDIRPSHVRHCIDLIRQSLMCQADTTVEVVDEAINGVHGFRVMHMCKDWSQLVRWTSRQQVGRKVEQIV